ncbi:hypothetical protein GC105_12335 [Alkalibaculum sp. M08DMB]|uniref:Autoinducer 2 import system permease protein LsrD n=1 Tax=Alkalibaculum sporogenes TaxID=2655001 RepID=A0A6A7KAZ9_9FIRM|nr:ABC transporter permease [Alkalibaculum sporogenes]MPW26576.1 hypothetical protein [Alkalibaculum sporogenes]
MFQFIKENRGTIIQYASLLFVILLFGIITGGNIFSSYNVKTLIGQISPLMIVSSGVVFMFANGSIDIASGAVIGLCAMLSALILNSTDSLPLALIVSVIVSIVLYLFSTFVSIKFGLVSTIASLAIMFMARGVITYVCSLMPSTVISLNNYSILQKFKTDPVLQIVITVSIVVITWIIFSFTKIGKGAIAIGDNPVSARQSGIKIEKTKCICAAIAGTCVGIASIFSLARAGSVTKNIGSGIEMDIMVAIILGGMSLAGGSKSKFSAAVIGTITFRLLSNGMTMSGVPTRYVSLIRGIIFLVIVFATLRQSKNVKEMPR